MTPNETTRLIPSNQSGRTTEESLELGELSDRVASPSSWNCCCNESGKSFVFGAFDGLISSLSIISACSGGGLSGNTILIVGFATLLSNSLTMGISEFLSSRAHKEFLQAEKRREMWEFKHYKDGEIQEMIKRFEARGMVKKDAELVVGKMAQYENFFVGLMVSEELGLQIPENDDLELFTDALVMFVSFCLFGALPIIFYLFGFMQMLSDHDLYILSSSLSLLIISGLGMVKSTFSSASVYYSGFEALSMGIIAASISYVTGALLANLINQT